ncbi:NTP_transf_2 domain-containing protein [Gammaproteobacteria bacterium]
MRLTAGQREVILGALLKTFGNGARIWLFGSRVNDEKRGGDIDLLVETDLQDTFRIVQAEVAFLATVKRELGDQKIDLLVDSPNSSPNSAVLAEARKTGVPL